MESLEKIRAHFKISGYYVNTFDHALSLTMPAPLAAENELEIPTCESEKSTGDPETSSGEDCEQTLDDLLGIVTRSVEHDVS
jgi:hypothetical protein